MNLRKAGQVASPPPLATAKEGEEATAGLVEMGDVTSPEGTLGSPSKSLMDGIGNVLFWNFELD